MKTVLVTGSEGQLAKHIFEESKEEKKFNFIFSTKKNLNISNKENLEDFFSSKRVDILINCAAFTDVDGAESLQDEAYEINHKAVKLLSQLAKKYDFTFVHISTDYVFDGKKRDPYLEIDKTNALGAYAKSKLSGERVIMKSSCKSIILRTSWLYSSFGNNFVETITSLAKKNKSLKVVSDQFGTPTSAIDLSRAIIHMIKSETFLSLSKQKEIFHFSNTDICSWYDLAEEVVRYLKLDCEVQPCSSDEYKTKVKRPFYSALDNNKFSKEFRFEINNWRQALHTLLDKKKIL